MNLRVSWRKYGHPVESKSQPPWTLTHTHTRVIAKSLVPNIFQRETKLAYFLPLIRSFCLYLFIFSHEAWIIYLLEILLPRCIYYSGKGGRKLRWSAPMYGYTYHSCTQRAEKQPYSPTTRDPRAHAPHCTLCNYLYSI